MNDVTHNNGQKVLSDTMDQLSLPARVREEALSAAGQQIAEALKEGNKEAIQQGIDDAYLTVSRYYQERLGEAMTGWVQEDKIAPDAAERMLQRVPDKAGEEFSGLDAGVAAGLGIVPEDKQTLIRSLHAYYTPDAVRQVREELSAGLQADHETTWWLSMCSECVEGQVDAKTFVAQIGSALELSAHPELRVERAQAEFEAMSASVDEIRDGVGYGKADGCIQGAYLNNCDVGVSDMRDIGAPIFIGSFRGSEIDVSSFPFGTETDERGRPMSGQIAPGFYKVADEAERDRLIVELKAQLDI